MRKYKWIIFILILVVVLLLIYYIDKKYPKNAISPQPSPSISLTTSPSIVNSNTLDFPIADFKSRITKKPFGVYITPQNSPVQPEKFSGYHTGLDVEYEDVTADVPVFAISDGKIVYSNWVSGYGGVFILEVNLGGKLHNVLYGHIRPSSLPNTGQTFKKGEKIAVLGTGYSQETDGERRHLHFAILSDNRIDLKGYVQNKSDLSGWVDPQTLYQ